MFGRARRNPRASLSPRERLARQAVSSEDGGRAGYTVALAIVVFLLVGALSARQVTSETRARAILAAGISTVTEIDLVLAEHESDLRLLAASSPTDPFLVPGYPLGVFVSKAEVQRSSTAELRQIIVDRSTGIVYAEGLAAFDRTGDQSLDTFPTQGLLEFFVGQLSKETHQRASIAALVLTAVGGLLGIGLILKGEGFGRIRAAGGAIMVGSGFGAALAWGFRWLVSQAFGADPFGEDLMAITEAVCGVPIRNYLTMAGLGAALFALGVASPPVAAMLDRERRPKAAKHRPIEHFTNEE